MWVYGVRILQGHGRTQDLGQAVLLKLRCVCSRKSLKSVVTEYNCVISALNLIGCIFGADDIAALALTESGGTVRCLMRIFSFGQVKFDQLIVIFWGHCLLGLVICNWDNSWSAYVGIRGCTNESA